MKYIIPFLFLWLSLDASAQKFPVIQGETPSGKNMTLPKDSKAKYTIIGFAYSQKAGDDLEGWYEPAYLKFIAKHGIFAGDYDVELYFVPMFVGGNKVAYGPALKRIATSAEPEIADHIVFYKGEIEPFQAELKGIDKKDVPYFFLMDANGIVVHREEGSFTEEKLGAFEDILFNAE